MNHSEIEVVNQLSVHELGHHLLMVRTNHRFPPPKKNAMFLEAVIRFILLDGHASRTAAMFMYWLISTPPSAKNDGLGLAYDSKPPVEKNQLVMLWLEGSNEMAAAGINIYPICSMYGIFTNMCPNKITQFCR